MKINKHMTQILVSALAVVFAVGFAPQMGAPVFADEGDPDISLGTQQLAENVNTDDAQTLWYGGRDWRVIAYDGKGADGEMITYQNPVGGTENLYQEGVITLFQSDVYENSTFSDHGGSAWDVSGFQGYGANAAGQPSILRQTIEGVYLNGDDTTPAVFSAKEVGAIAARTLPGYGYEWSSYTDPGAYDSNRINMNDLNDALVWPLSHAEADKVNWGIRIGAGKDYWIRSSGRVNSYDIMVRYGAKIDGGGKLDQDEYTSYEDGVRPAFYLSENSVLLTSAAYSGKESGKTGPNAMKKVSENTDNEWKVTLADSDHKNFKIDSAPTEMTCLQTLTMQYSGAATGTNEFISAVIADKNGKVTYYGRLKKCADSADASGEVTVTLKNKYKTGDKLYLFSEQTNGDELTDYASAMQEIAVPAWHHDLDATEAKAASCTDPGNSAYWTCRNCGLFFSDERAEHQIDKDSWVIPATGHKEKWNHGNTHPATFEDGGWIEVRCEYCNTLLPKHDIAQLKTVELTPTEYTYDGGKKTPAVTVTDVEGQVVTDDNYNVAYTGNTDVGTATTTVTFNGDLYSGEKSMDFSINKAANTLSIKGKTAKIKAKKLKKKTQSLAVGKVIAFTKKGQGKLTYTKVSGKKKITINATTGKVTVKKKLKKGTYKVKVRVQAAGDSNYEKSAVKEVTFKIKVK